MKILHVSTIIEWRGGDSQMLTTFNILKGFADIEQVILCPSGSVLESKCKEAGIPHYSASRKSKFSVPFIQQLINVVKEEKVDVLHVHDSNSFSLSLVALKFLRDVKFVYSRKRNNHIKKNYFKNLKYNNDRINRIVCVSDAVRNVLLPVVKNPEKIEVIYDGIDVAKFGPKSSREIIEKDFNITPDTFVIGNIAGLTKQKDLKTFLDAAKKIKEKHPGKLKFLILGKGPLEEEIKAYTAQISMEDDVIFTGFRSDVAEILPELDLFLNSSETEGLPLSIMEAFACKVPVAATAAGGTGEAIQNKITGMISPVKEPEELANNALLLIQNEELKKEIIENAYNLVHKKFTLDVMQKEYAEFYRSLVEN
ncbi:MAG: glycosyltransferase [Salegentibacter sp.]